MATNKNSHAKGSPLGTDPCSECPVCSDQSLPPVSQCLHGHLICESCLPHLEKRSVCPVPNPKRKRIQDFETESVAMMRSHPCKYKDNGCEANLRYDQLLHHQSDCHYMPVKVCTILGLSGCEENVLLSDFARHLNQVHKLKMSPAVTKDRGGRNFVRWGLFTVDTSVTKNTNWVIQYFLSSQHKDREVLWAFVLSQRRNRLEWRLFVLRGPAFVSRCRCSVAIMTEESMGSEQLLWTSGTQWVGPCLGLDPSEEEMKNCFVTPVSTIKKFIRKDGDQDCLRLKWKLMIEDEKENEQAGAENEEDGEDGSPHRPSDPDSNKSIASTPLCITISDP